MSNEDVITAVLAYTIAAIWAASWVLSALGVFAEIPTGVSALMMLVAGLYFGDRAMRRNR